MACSDGCTVAVTQRFDILCHKNLILYQYKYGILPHLGHSVIDSRFSICELKRLIVDLRILFALVLTP
ncbi:MAG: hypothetical protein COA85_06080 [Robiginitomaculum sp.]|nr:MAG: hypothetical protein COA85_06080 [Robiginitomaculum sp.]